MEQQVTRTWGYTEPQRIHRVRRLWCWLTEHQPRLALEASMPVTGHPTELVTEVTWRQVRCARCNTHLDDVLVPQT